MKDNKKIAHTRRNRGYSFEHGLVLKFNEQHDWCARRLGGSSTGLPDLIATSKQGTILSIECKSTQHGNDLYVPQDQVLRCIDVLSLFHNYPDKEVIFAFKFGQSKGRKKKELFYSGNRLMGEILYNMWDHLQYVKCKRDGNCSIVYDKFTGYVDEFVLYPAMTFEQLIKPDCKV